MTEMRTYTEDNGDAIAALLIGRRIVSAEKGSFVIPSQHQGWRDDPAEGLLTLDDGTKLYLRGHEGGCSCGAGDYALEKVASVNNVITDARVQCSPAGDDLEGEGVYRIFVFAENVEISVAEFVGSDGNGYYGSGFSLIVESVEPPDAQ